VNCHPNFDAEGVAKIIATYLQGLFRTALLSVAGSRWSPAPMILRK
jgi:hypothetical protein